MEIEGGVANGGCCNLRADGSDGAIDAQPDHYFVGLAEGAICTDEGVVGDICFKGVAGVARVRC